MRGKRRCQTQIMIDEFDVLGPPAQFQGALLERILQLQTLLIGEHLVQRGLSDVLSRDFDGISKKAIQTDAASPAISSLVAARSSVNSSARCKALRRERSGEHMNTKITR